MSNGLSRVSWAMGQALLPEHLRMLEGSLMTDSAKRSSHQEAPCYGLYKVSWNETLLVDGVLSLEEMTLVMPSGLLLELKENVKVEPLNLKIPGTSTISVYLHVRTYSEPINSTATNKNIVKHGNVSCWLWQIDLSNEQEHSDTLETFHLADFQKQADSSWQLSTAYIPPLGCFGSVPFLKDDFKQLKVKLEAYHYQLTQEVAAIYLSGSDLFDTRESLKSVVNMLRFLGNLFAEINVHPYTMYERLKSFYIDLAFYHNNTPDFATSCYQHDNLTEVFNEILGPLNHEIQFTQTRVPYLPFTLANGIFQVNMPEEIRKAKEFYFLVQNAAVNQSISIDGMKLAAISRIPIVHKFYLQGLSLIKIDRPPFQHSFGPEIDLYQITKGEEWDYALNELALGFIPESSFSSQNFFLNWRTL
jgi:type VI secretion system protein ImpJ